MVELRQEADDKIADIKKLAYDVSTKLKSIISYFFYFILLHVLYSIRNGTSARNAR